jgi:predicted branched-subunit amino acid permease
MSHTSPTSAYWSGFRDSAPFILIVAPFGMLFGVLATEAGLDLLATMAFTVTVFAGASQLTALQLLEENALTFIVLASALAVNLRMAMYSASLTPYLGGAPFWQRALASYFLVDQVYALSIVKFETEPKMSVSDRVKYMVGTVSPVAPTWYLSTLMGALIGTQIPESWALDFALPIAFIAMVTPMLRTAAHVAAACTAIVVALLCAGLPLNLGLMAGGLAGMMAGAQVENLMRKRGTWT